MKLTRSTIFITTVIVLTILAHFNIAAAPEGAQKSAYPNTNEAAITTVLLKKSKFKAPLLSQILREQLSHRRLRKSDFLELFKYGVYQMSRGEAEQMFYFIDSNKDDMIDMGEWAAFGTLFIKPFEACDTSNNYLLELKEFKYCYDKDPKTKVIEFRRRQQKTRYELLMDTISTRGRSVVNFIDYVFLRRALFGWMNCHSSNKYIALSAFKCAVSTAIPQKLLIKYHIEKIYFSGKKLANDKNLLQLDFISYLRTLQFTYVFSIVGLPHDTPAPMIEKSQFNKAIREDRIPMNINEEEVEIWYKLIDSTPFVTAGNVRNKYMDFDTFCFFYNYHRIFYKYNMEKPLQISKDEVMKAMGDTYWPDEVLQSLDVAHTEFTEPQYMEVTNILQRLRLNERDFYNRSFLELSSEKKEAKAVKTVAATESAIKSNLALLCKAVSANKAKKVKVAQDTSLSTASLHNKTTIENNYWDKKPNMANRKVYFDTMTGIDKRYWTQEIFFKAALLSNFFVDILGEDAQHDKNWIIGVSQFIDVAPHHWETAIPTIGLHMRSNHKFYKSLPHELDLDIIGFIQMENFDRKVQTHKTDSTERINEGSLKIIMKDYGMINMPDTIIDLTAKGNDILGRRMFDPKTTLTNIITIQAAAGDDIRSKGRIKEFGLKKNADPSRAFNDESGKRFFASPLV
jgi:hypothetical protein